MGFPQGQTELFGGLGFSNTFEEHTITNKLLAHFPLDEATSAIRYPNFGRIAFAQFNNVTRVSGVSNLTGFATRFNGTNQYLSGQFAYPEFAPASGGPGVAGNSGKIMESKVPGEWTMAGWVNLRSASPKNPAGIEEIVSKWGRDSTANRGWVLQYVHSGMAFGRAEGFAFQYSHDGSDDRLINYGEGSGVALDAWHHVRITVSASANRVTMQVDDGFLQTLPLGGSGIYNTDDPLEFGRLDIQDAAFTDYAGVDLTNWSFWGRAISEEENTRMYNNGSGLGFPWGPRHSLEAGIQAHWSMNEFAGQAYDMTGHSRAFTSVNGSPTADGGVVGSGRAFKSSLSQWLEIANASAPWASIGDRDWTLGVRVKINQDNFTNSAHIVAKNNETGIGGLGSEWGLSVFEAAGNVPKQFNWRVLYDGAPFETSVRTSGVTNGAIDDGEYHSVMVGYIFGSGTWIQIDGGEFVGTPELAGGQNNGNADLTIGRRDHATPLFFDGTVNDVTIWHRFPTAKEREFFLTGAV